MERDWVGAQMHRTSARQRIVVLNFETPELALLWDELTDDEVWESLRPATPPLAWLRLAVDAGEITPEQYGSFLATYHPTHHRLHVVRDDD